jgi:predicted HTH domain antitoxin
MVTVNIKIPEAFLLTLNENPEELSSQMRLYSALQFYKNHKLTLKQAAEFAGLPLSQFVFELNQHEIDVIDYDPRELKEETELFKE